jgi:hypothetical protein
MLAQRRLLQLLYETNSSYLLREAIERLLNRDWFCRAWVYQEAVVSTSVEVVWGGLSIPFNFVAWLVIAVHTLAKGHKYKEWYEKIRQSKGFGPLRTIYYDRQAYVDKSAFDILPILWRARKYLQATDNRDLIYSFLGFYAPGKAHEIIPNYSVPLKDSRYSASIENTYIDFAHSIIRSSRSLDIFQCVVPTVHSKYRLPSWVPNWAERRFKGGIPIMSPGIIYSFNACRGVKHISTITNLKKLHVQGHILGKVRWVLPKEFGHLHHQQNPNKEMGLHKLTMLVFDQLKQQLGDDFDLSYSDIEAIIFRTILAVGPFSMYQPIQHSISDLLRVFDREDGSFNWP